MPSEAKERLSLRWQQIVVLMGATGMAGLTWRLISPLAPFLSQEIGLGETEIGLLSASVMVGSLVMTVPAGRLADSRGIRQLVSVSLGILFIDIALGSLGSSFWALMAVLLVAGALRSVVMPAVAKFVMITGSPGSRGTIMATVLLGPPVAGVLASVILPVIGSEWGWQGALRAVAVPLILLALAASRLLPREEARPARSGQNSAFSLFSLFEEKGFLALSVVHVIQTVVLLCLTVFYPMYLHSVKGVSVVAAGFYLAVAQGSGAGARVVWGALSDRAFSGRRQPVLLIIACLTIVSLVWLSHASPSGLIMVILSLLLGASAMAPWPMVVTLAAELCGTERAGSSSALMLGLVWATGVLGPPVFGRIVEVSSYWVGWYALAMATAVTVVVLVLGRIEARV